MLVTMRKDETLIFGGSSEPAALAQLYYAAGGVTCKQTPPMRVALLEEVDTSRRFYSCCRLWA